MCSDPTPATGRVRHLRRASTLCRVSVRFTNPAIQFDYRAEQSTARRFGAAMAPTGAEVTIEFDPGESCIAALPPLPCARLWA